MNLIFQELLFPSKEMSVADVETASKFMQKKTVEIFMNNWEIFWS